MTVVNINLLSIEQLKNNLIIVSIGTEDNPATTEEGENIAEGINTAINKMKLDFVPSFLITAHPFNIESSVKIKEIKEKNKKFTRFEIMDV